MLKAHRPFQPVILGGDIGAYALARELNDSFGCTSILVTAYYPRAIQESRILTRRYFKRANEAEPLAHELIRIAQGIRRKQPTLPLLLLANTDWRIDALSRFRPQLEDYYIVPIPQRRTIDQVINKQNFARIAHSVGMRVPTTFYQDFSHADDSAWQPKPLPNDMSFPVVAKPADSSTYEQLSFPGRQKVYRIENQDQLDRLWQALRRAGFRSTFLAQQLIPGDDTCMYSVTAYVDRRGTVTMMSAAHVLLQEHHPAMLGNPCAMITEPLPELTEPAQRFLQRVDYHGFANFDVKRDARDGTFYFLEINPRIGRNSYYCVGAGINPMDVLVDDVIDEKQRPEGRADRLSLYTLVPRFLLRRYVQPDTWRTISSLYRSGNVVNPLHNPRDASLKRRRRIMAIELGLVKKFRTYYPQQTETGF
ncbi:MAG: carboxylate--amine ligase [Actinomycetaceae bacterium]|nr:carboxylate--amine ligase [Actinomycetaceae bacterium]MDY6083084.1 carboxylate--amine ligase [Actinomycetaceae bacterium]